MKNKKSIIYIAFTLAGSVINFIFYLKFFKNTNYDPWVYIIISVLLTGITAIFYYDGFKRKNKAIITAACFISIFSIFCSTSGQFADSQKKINDQVEQNQNISNNQSRLSRAWSEIDRINTAWEKLESQKKDIDTTRERANWRSTIKSIETRQDSLIKEKKYYESMVYADNNQETVSVYAADIFDQITTNVKQKIIIMLIFEIIISIIIEIIAPISLYLMSSQIKTFFEPEQKVIKKKTYRDLVVEYANARFNGSDSNILKGRPVVIKSTGMSISAFNKITSLAIKKGLIVIDGKIAKSADFVDKQDFLKRMLPEK